MIEGWSPNVGPYWQHKKIWRWEVVGGICMSNGYRNGAELGVSTGRFTLFLCTLMPDMRMTSVDLWAEQPENTGKETYVGWGHENSLANFRKAVELNFPDRVKIIQEHTVKAAEQVADKSLDFIFIDADHSYEACLADIKAWTPKVRDGGLISGHDFSWPGVTQAVTETGTYVRASDDVWLRFKQ